MSTSLGSLILTLGLDTSDLERKMAQTQASILASAKVAEDRLKLKPVIDDSALTSLNRHLDLKQRHFTQVQRDFDLKPLKPKADTSGLNEIDKRLDGYGKRSTTLSLKPSVSEQGLDQSFTELETHLDKFSDKLTKSMRGVGGHGGGFFGGILSDLKTGLFEGITLEPGIQIGASIVKGLDKGLGIDMMKSVENASAKAATAAKVPFDFVINNEQLQSEFGKTSDVLGRQFRQLGYHLGDAIVAGLEDNRGGLQAVSTTITEAFNFQSLVQGSKTAATEIGAAFSGVGKTIADQALSPEVFRTALQPIDEGLSNYRKVALQERAIPLVQERAQEILNQKRTKNSAKQVDESTDDFFITTGGYAGARGLSGDRLAKTIKTQASENAQVVWVKNQDSDIPKASMGSTTDKLQALLVSLAKPNLRGYSNDAVEMAAQGRAAYERNPNINIKIIGESGGGFAAEEAHHLLQRMGIKADFIGVGTPNLIGGLDRTGKKIISPDEHLGAEASLYSRYGLADMSHPSQQVVGVGGHPYEHYQESGVAQLQNFIQGAPAKLSQPQVGEIKKAADAFKAIDTSGMSDRELESTAKQAYANMQMVIRHALVAGDETKAELEAIAQSFKEVYVATSREASDFSTIRNTITRAKEVYAQIAAEPGLESGKIAQQVIQELQLYQREFAALRNHAVGTQGAKYSALSGELQSLVKQFQDPALGLKQPTRSAVAAPSQSMPELQALTVPDLRAIARKADIPGRSQARTKSELADLLQQNASTEVQQLTVEQSGLKRARDLEKQAISLVNQILKEQPHDASAVFQGLQQLYQRQVQLTEQILQQPSLTGEARQQLGGSKGRINQAIVRLSEANPAYKERLDEMLQGSAPHAPPEPNQLAAVNEGLSEYEQKIHAAYRTIAQSAAKASGIALDPAKLPKLNVSNAIAGGASALYDIGENAIHVNEDIGKVLADGAKAWELQQHKLENLVHELRHSFQFDFGEGSLFGMASGTFASPVPLQRDDSDRIQSHANKSLEVARHLSPSMTPAHEAAVRAVEVDAYKFQRQTPSIIGEAIKSVGGIAPAQTAKPQTQMLEGLGASLARMSTGGSFVAEIGGGIDHLLDHVKTKMADIQALKPFVGMVDGLKSVSGLAVSAFGAFAGFQIVMQGIQSAIAGIGQSFEVARKFDNFRTALDFASGSAVKADADFKFIDQTVDELKIPLEGSRLGFERLAASTRGTASAGVATKSVFTGVSQAATVLGLSSEDAQGALEAVAKIASSGTVSMEVLRKELGNHIPGAFKIAADAMGVTEAQLDKLVSTGTVTADDFLPKFGQALQSNFAGSAISASKNAQSALFAYQTAFSRLQEDTGKSIQPAAVLYFNTLATATDLLRQHSKELGVVMLAFIFPALESLWKILGKLIAKVIEGGESLVAFRSIAIGAMKQLIETAVVMTAKFVLIELAIESFQSAIRLLTINEQTKQFKDFTDQAVKGLERVTDAARNANGETSKIGKKTENPGAQSGEDLNSEGFNFFGVFKSDDILKQTNRLQRSANRLVGRTGQDEHFGELKTVAQQKFEDEQVDAGNQQKAAQDIAQASITGNFNTKDAAGNIVTTNTQIAKVKEFDQQIKAVELQKANLTYGNANPDKTALDKLEKQRVDLNQQKELAAAPLVEQNAQLQNAIKNTQAAIEANNKKYGEGSDRAEQANNGYKSTLKVLQNAELYQGKWNQKLNESATLVANFAQKWSEVAAKAQDAQKAIDLVSVKGKADIIKQQVSGGLNNEQVQQKTADQDVVTANEKLNASQDSVAKQKELLQTIGASTTLKAAGINPDAGVNELKNASNTDAAKNNAKLKQSLEAAAQYREAQDQLPNQQLQVEQSRLQQMQTERQLAANLRQRSGDNDAAFATRTELTRNTKLRSDQAAINVKKSKNFYYSDADAGVAEANLGISQAQSQQQSAGAGLANSSAALSRLREDYKAGKIDQIDFKNQERDLITQAAQARAKGAEAEAQIEEAKGKRIEAVNRKRIEQIQEVTQAEAAALARRQALSNADFATQRASLTMKRAKNVFYSDADAGVAEADLGIKQASVQKDFAGQALTNANRELQRNSQLYKEGRINAKTFHDQERDLITKVTEARAHGTEAAAALEEAYAKKIEASNRQKLEQIDQLQKKAEAAIALTQTKGTTELQSNLLNSTDAGELSQGQSGRSQVLLDQTAAAARTALKQQELEQTRQFAKHGVISRKDAADKEMAIVQSLADAQQQSMQRQVQMTQQLRDSRIKLLEGTAKLESEQIDRAKQLLDAQGALAKAQNDLSLTRTQGAINQADRAFGLKDKLESQKDLDPRLKALMAKQLNESGLSGINANSKSYEILAAKQKLEDEASEKTKAAREQEFDLAKKSFEFDQKKIEAADKLLVIEAKRYKLDADKAKIQAIKDYRQAEKSGDKEGMQLAKASFEIAGDQGKLANEQLSAANDRLNTDKQLADIGRQTLGINQQKAREEAFNADQLRKQNNDLSFGEQYVKAGGMGAIPGRATGGDVASDRPYLVGEQGQEIFIPKVNGEIIPAHTTDRLLKATSMIGLSTKEAAIAQAMKAGQLPARANGGSVMAGHPYLVGEKGTEAAIDTAIRPTISGNGMLDTAFHPTIAGNGQLDTAFHPAISGNGQLDTAFHPTITGAGVNNFSAPAPDISARGASAGIADSYKASATQPVSSIGNSFSPSFAGISNQINQGVNTGSGSASAPSGVATGGGGNSNLDSKLDQLISLLGSSLNSPRSLTVSSPSPVQDAAKIMSDIATQNTSNAGL